MASEITESVEDSGLWFRGQSMAGIDIRLKKKPQTGNGEKPKMKPGVSLISVNLI